MNPEDRRERLHLLVEVLEPDASDRPLARFLPLPMHSRVLDPRRLLVLGQRGAGKTALFQFLDEISRAGVPWRDVAPTALWGAQVEGGWVQGFGVGPDHPLLGELDGLEGPGDPLRWWWFGALVARLSPQVDLPLGGELAALPQLYRDDPGALAAAARARSSALVAWLEAVDRRLDAEGAQRVLTYDQLDRIGGDQGLSVAAAHVAALVSLWMELRVRLRRVQAKIFLRGDLLDRAASLRVDGSKWRGVSAELQWSPEDIYRVLLRRLGADEKLREWLAEGHDGVRFTHNARLGYLPPTALPQQLGLFHEGSNVASQKTLASRLAGETMGKGARKGYTHRWIINHTRDGLGRVVPRSVLGLVRHAARIHLERSPTEPPAGQLLWPADLERAKEPTGRERLDELREEHPVVGRLDALRGRKTPFREAELVELLGEPPEGQAEDGAGHDGAAALHALVAIGALQRRSATRLSPAAVDVPELLRAALGVHRRGGVSPQEPDGDSFNAG